MSTAAPPRPRQAGERAGEHNVGLRRTLRVFVALALGLVPLCQLFTDRSWLTEVWLAGAVALLPVLLLRLWSRPRYLQLPAGAALAVVWLTARYVPTDAYGGLVPSGRTWQDVHAMIGTLGDTVRTQSAPLPTTPEIRLALAAGFAALVLLVDAVAVIARRPAVATLPLLVIYTVSGAVPRQAVQWVWFVSAAIGFLLVLSSDSSDVLARWGRLMPRSPGAATPRAVLARAGRWVGVVAIAVAVVLPPLLPSRGDNALSDALHSSGHGATGTGSGPGVALNPFVALRGQLVRGQPERLFTVTVRDTNGTAPFYVRANVLDAFNGSDWYSTDHGDTQRLSGTSFQSVLPQPAQGPSYRATFSIDNLRDLPPLFSMPTSTQGLPSRLGWSPKDGLVVGTTVEHGATYSEDVRQLSTSATALRASAPARGAAVERYLQLPSNVPQQVRDLVRRLTGGVTNQYDAVTALLSYLSPQNGFVYSLQTEPGDSGSDLVNFLLINKAGFCQQYAAGLATMMRLAGIPSRIVLGYTHEAPDAAGHFTVTTTDAHAWVEGYFPSVGWVPFDPTPLTGSDAARAARIPWSPNGAQNPLNAAGTTAAPSVGNSGEATANKPGLASPTTATSGSTTTSGSGGSLSVILTIVVAVLALLGLLAVPASLRLIRRRRRLRAARGGDADALWAELTATATDLGYVLSPARSPRQQAGDLGSEIDDRSRAALGTLAAVVERARYAPTATAARPAPGEQGPLAELAVVEAALRRTRPGRARMIARVRPASLIPTSLTAAPLASARRWGLRLPRRH